MKVDEVAFILARIREDDQSAGWAARLCPAPWWLEKGLGYHATVRDDDDAPVGGTDEALWVAEHIARFDPARMTAECAVKRWLVRHCVGDWVSEFDDGAGGSLPYGVVRQYDNPILHAIASVYADHADFDPAWAVESPII